MLMIIRSELGCCSQCHLIGDNFAVEEDDGQRLLCVPCLEALEPGRSLPEPFGKTPRPCTNARPHLGCELETMTEKAFFSLLKSSDIEREIYRRCGWHREE